MADEQFNIRMEKMDDHTSTDKYAIIGYFESKQREHNKNVARVAAEVDPEAANPTPSKVIGSPTNCNCPQSAPVAAHRKVVYRKSHLLADSRAEHWLLALIAFLLFLNLICKD